MERASRPPESAGAGYLCFQSASDDANPEGTAEWAALLVVGPDSLPQEFLYSGPLRPTPVQGILYQDRLLPEIRLSLVRSLLRGMRSRPAFVALRAEDAAPELLAELRLPALLLTEGDAGWSGAPDAAAEAIRESVERVVGAEEPLGRAVAALAYVVEYERSRTASAA